jgi:thiol-disulfide isomerase/thioredoxin
MRRRTRRGTARRHAGALAVLLIAACSPTPEPDLPPFATDGLWRVVLTSEGGALPFLLRVQDERAVVINGDERLVVPLAPASDESGVLRLEFDVDSSLSLRGEPRRPGRMIGAWTLERGALPRTEMVATATRLDPAGDARRFFDEADAVAEDGAPDEAEPAGLAPRYRVEFSSSDEPAVGLFETFPGGIVHGTFLTTTGDYRYLAGDFDGRRLRLSCFDGAHAFLFEARRADDGTLSGDFWSRDSWHETFTAVPDENAALPDGFGIASVDEAVDPGSLTFTDLEGESRRLDDEAFTGKARVWVVFGSWCPNCHDATRLWAELHRRYRDRGLSVVGLAFERSDDLAHERAKVRAFVERQGIEFPVLIAGLADKDAASRAFPVLDRVRAFPTTLFLDAEGAVRAVHSGFSGPATGEAHAALVERFEALVEELLGS